MTPDQLEKSGTDPPDTDDAVFDVVRETVAELEMLTARLKSFLGELDD